MIRQVSDFDKLKTHIEMTVTAEGLRIELLESETGTFFESGNSNPTDSAREILTVLAQELGMLPNRVSIEGHTDSRPFSAGANYTTGSSRPIAPMLAGGSCSRMGCAWTR